MTSIETARGPTVIHTPRPFTVEIFSGAGLKSVGWPSVEAGLDLKMHVYQSAEFLDVWMATIGKARGAQCFLVIVKDRQRQPVLYLPLAIETKFNIRFLRFMDGGVVDFNGPIVVSGREPSACEFAGIWSDILSLLPEVDVIDLQKIAGHMLHVRNPLTHLECDSYISSGHSIQWDCLLPDGEPSHSLVKMRKKMRRQHQRLCEMAPTEFVTAPTGPDVDRIMNALIELKRQQYMRTNGRDFFEMPGVYDFYRAMAAPDRLGRISHLSALICGEKVLAAHLGFIGRGRFYYVLPAFDTEYRPYAAGFLLLDHLVDSSRTEFAAFDLGEGDFSYKDKWATHQLPLWSCEQAMSATGLLYRPLRRVRQFVDGSHLSDLYGKSRRKPVKPHVV